MNHVRMVAIASLPVIIHEDENTDDDRNIAAIKRWKNLVLKQHKLRRKQHLWSALGESLRDICPSLRARLSKTDRGRDGDTRASSSGIAGCTANDAPDETAV